MKAIVVYYSMSGNCEYAANAISAEIGADTLRLEPIKAYPSKGFRKFFWGGKSAVMAETPELLPYGFDGAAYDAVIFGFPVWASTVTPPIRTFIKENTAVLAEKKIYAFATQSGNGAEKAFVKLCEALGRDALDGTLVLIDPKDNPSREKDEKIRSFCMTIQGEHDE